jgi:hypothetical protein
MTDIPEKGSPSRQRLSKEYEDPHYHDDEEAIAPDDQPHGMKQSTGDNKKRRIPPPRPRHFDD